jgi:uncharacterized protein (DUF433 family)
MVCFPLDVLARITHDPKVMGGRPCIRGMRVTVGTIVGLLASGQTPDDILKAYPYLERDEQGALVTVDERDARIRVLPIR